MIFLVLLKQGLLWKGWRKGLSCNYVTWADWSNRRYYRLTCFLPKSQRKCLLNAETSRLWTSLERQEKKEEHMLHIWQCTVCFEMPNRNIWAVLSHTGFLVFFFQGNVWPRLTFSSPAPATVPWDTRDVPGCSWKAFGMKVLPHTPLSPPALSYRGRAVICIHKPSSL